MDQNLMIRFSDLKSWSNYTKYISTIVDKIQQPIFRGQGNEYRTPGKSDAGWRLEPSLYRPPTISHPQFINWVKRIFNDHECISIITKTTGRPLTGDNESDRLLMIGLLRHFRFKTPLLDWTKNPFIAAYFAFHDIHERAKYVTIFLFDQKAWMKNSASLTSRDLNIIKLRMLDHLLPRQKAQESIYTYSLSTDVYSELLGDEAEGRETFIAVCSLPLEDRQVALNQLRDMGISDETLFPDLREIDEMKNRLEFLMRNLRREDSIT